MFLADEYDFVPVKSSSLVAEALEYAAEAVGREYSITSTPSHPDSISATSFAGIVSSYFAMNHLSNPSFLVLASNRPQGGNMRSKLTEPTSIKTLSICVLPDVTPPLFVAVPSLAPGFIFMIISPWIAVSGENTMTGLQSADSGPLSSFPPIPLHPASIIASGTSLKNLSFIIDYKKLLFHASYLTAEHL